jgi:hypothetical protein
MKIKSLPAIASALSGLAVWGGIGFIIHNPEAWDSALYWKAGIPFLAIVTFIIGYFVSETPFIWGIIQALSQSALILVQGLLFGYSLNLWPPSVVVNIIIAIPSIISAFLDVALSNYIKKQRTAKQI